MSKKSESPRRGKPGIGVPLGKHSNCKLNSETIKRELNYFKSHNCDVSWDQRRTV